MASVLSNYAGNAAWAYLLAGTKWLALHESDPTVTGLLASEVAGGAYERQPITHAVNGKNAVSTKGVIFPGMPACVVTYLAVWDALSVGHLICSKILTPAIAVLESGQFLATPGDIAWGL